MSTITIMLVASKMTDIHTHILFGMDDGAKDIDASLEMLKEQVNQGITQIVLTPHFLPFKDDLDSFIEKRNKHFEILKRAVVEQGLEVELKIGAEIMFSHDILSMDLSDLTIEDTNYLLIEFPTKSHIDHVESAMNQLMNNGYDLIFAHIERYSFLKEDLTLMKRLVESGILFQVNGSSIENINENSFVEACLNKNYIHLIASDAHNNDTRKPNIGNNNFKHLKKKQLEKLNNIYENANAVFNNEIISNDSNYKNIKVIFNKYY